jgi:hypothetical protein
MALYRISYDLLNKKTFGEYETLISELRRIGAKEVLFSEWVWKGENYSCKEMREHLKKFVHADDRILSLWLATGLAGMLCLISIIFKNSARLLNVIESSSFSGSKCNPACHQYTFIIFSLEE